MPSPRAGAEIWVGVRTLGTEVAARVDVIRDGDGRGRGRAGRAPQPHDDRCSPGAQPRAAATTCATPGRTGWPPGSPTTPARTGWCRTSCRCRRCGRGLPLREPVAVHARAGALLLRHDDAGRARDLGGGSGRRRCCAHRGRPGDRWRAGGVRVVPPTRSPRRPAAASAGPAISTTPPSPRPALRAAGAERVAVVDIDAHHGNGTQSLFYDRADVFYASLHVDPGPAGSPTWWGSRTRPVAVRAAVRR